GTMEMLLAQPVRRTSLYTAQAVVTVVGSAILAAAVWSGTAIGLRAAPLYASLSATIYIPPTVNLFGLMVCWGGIAAFVSAWDSQRWRTVGIVTALYILSTAMAVAGQLVASWHWLTYATVMSAYKPQTMVARPSEAWSLLAYGDGSVVGVGLGGQTLILLGIGVLCYVAGCVVFNRREIPAPI
ncbi:MAG: hypothetical protein ABIU95_00020, partial [Burkholderiales bacterium]